MSLKGSDFMATSAPGARGEASALAGEMVGIWRIVERLGGGGMGAVYRAERADGLYEQAVALKLMAPGNEARARRFERERQMLARLDHPGIARIIDGGTDEAGRPFLVMELVEGLPVDDWVERNAPPVRDRIDILRQLCAALGHAHARLLLHRDVKPGNVLVDKGETVRLVDFGISASLDDEESANDLAGRAHTPGYAAPEQLEDGSETVATDVFATGCLAYHVLTGNAPARRDDGGILLARDAIGDRDLEAILARATATEPADRYASIGAMNADLSAWLEKRPVDAREGGALYRTRRFVERYPGGVALASIAVLALAGGLAASLLFADRAQAERDRAEDALVRAEWNLEMSELSNQTMSAYADVLQYLFGDEGELDSRTALLLDRARAAQDNAGDDPETAAYLSYAVGRHFIFRNDYRSAITVLEPWVAGGWGSERLQNGAKSLLALAYRATGKPEEAIALQREVEQRMARTLDANTPDHAAAASQLALLTMEPVDLARGEEVLTATLQNEEEPQVLMFLWNQLSRIAAARGRLPQAYRAMQKVVAIIDADRQGEISGQDTGRLNLARYELFYTGDAARVRTLLEEVREDAKVRGPSAELARALWYQAELDRSEGNLAQALENIAEAEEMVVRFVGEQGPLTSHIRMAHAQMLARSGDHSAAARKLASAAEQGTARRALAQARLDFERAGPDLASERLIAGDLDRAEVSQEPELVWRYRQLQRDGLSLANLPQAARTR